MGFFKKIFTKKDEAKEKNISEKRKSLVEEITESTNKLSFDEVKKSAKKNPDKPFFQNIKTKEEFKMRNIISGIAALAAGGDMDSSEASNEIIKYASKGIKINPNSIYLLQMRGRSYGDIGSFKEGLRDLNKAIKLKPDYADAFVERGYIKQKMGDEKGANEDYTKARKIDSGIVLPTGN
jgi:tetratricopeptide (TPR) repeat protein